MYYLVYGILYLFSLLPFFILYQVSSFTAFILYMVARYRVDVVMNNLNIAFPEKSPEEKRKIARRFYRNLTDNFIETIKLLSISETSFHKRISIDMSPVMPLIEKGLSIQFHSGHQFGWEFGNRLMPQKIKIPFVGIYMRITNKTIDRIFYNLCSKSGTVLIAAQDYRKRMHQVFQSQYATGFLADQNPGMPKNAFWLNFFGRPVSFVTGPEKSAKRHNAAVVFLRLVKLSRGKYRMDLTQVIENTTSLEKGKLTLMYRDFLEKTIQEYPDSYLWSHRRWKWDYNETYEKNWVDTKAPVLN